MYTAAPGLITHAYVIRQLNHWLRPVIYIYIYIFRIVWLKHDSLPIALANNPISFHSRWMRLIMTSWLRQVFRITGILWGGSSNADLWWFLCYWLQQAVEQTVNFACDLKQHDTHVTSLLCNKSVVIKCLRLLNIFGVMLCYILLGPHKKQKTEISRHGDIFSQQLRRGCQKYSHLFLISRRSTRN